MKTDRAVSPDRSNRFFLIILAAFVCAQIVKLLFLAPLPEFGGDAAQKWFLAKDLASGSLEFYRIGDLVNHHFLRWATWLPALFFIILFGDSVTSYYLATFVPSLLAAILFIWLFYRFFGVGAAALLAVVWFFDPQLNRALFQLLPTGSGLLPLALLVWSIQRYLDGKTSANAFVAMVGVCVFWLYGAKETNIFFAPGVFLVVWLLTSRKHALSLVLFGAALYAVEAVVLSLLQGEVLIGGRILALLSPDAVHVNQMFKAERILEETNALWDAGIISRWYTVLHLHMPIYIPSIVAFFAVCLAFFTRRRETDRLDLPVCLSLIAVSFVVLTSFFILSLDPIRLGQPIRPRYIAVLLPLSYFMLIYALCQIMSGQVWGRVGKLGLGVAVAASVIVATFDRDYRIGFLRETLGSVAFLFNERKPLVSWLGHYDTLGKDLTASDCQLPDLEFKKLYFSLMYVTAENNGIQRLRAFEGLCPQTAGLSKYFQQTNRQGNDQN